MGTVRYDVPYSPVLFSRRGGSGSAALFFQARGVKQKANVKPGSSELVPAFENQNLSFLAQAHFHHFASQI